MANAIMLKPPAAAVFVKTYTFTENFETTAPTIYEEIMSGVPKAIGDCFLCYVHGNTAPQNYAPDVFVFGADSSSRGFCTRNNWQTERDANVGTSVYIYAGATVDIYKIDLRNFV